MKNKCFTSIVLIIICFFSLNACSNKDIAEQKANSIFQYSTLSALLEGVYDGEMTIAELKKHGDFGIGTFNALDGEMILFQGQCYKVTSDSKVVKVSDSEKTPFAAICSFVPDTIFQINHALNLKELKLYIDSVVPSNNLMYACKISGNFDTIAIRSVPKQEKPYKRLIEAYKAQGIYTFTHQEGILFGYKFPKYLKDVNMDDYHMHYLSTDKSKGGHLLNCKLSQATVSVAYIRNYSLQLPDNSYFNKTAFINKKAELLKIEGNGK
jgi:acetolactate decarboxylase